MIHRINIILLSIILIFSQTFIIANAAPVGGWNISNPVAQGASVVYDATKNVLINGKDYIKKSSVKIKPNATQVAKVLARGGAGYALSVAVEQLLGAVDWVLDPANNQIKYYPDAIAGGQYVIGCTISNCNYENSVVIASIDSMGVNPALDYVCTYFAADGYRYNVSTCRSRSTQQTVGYHKNVTLPASEGEEKSIPLDVVAAQVISNAESDTDKRAAAQVATTAAAADIVAEAETDNTKARPIANQAEANAETKPADETAAEKSNTAEGEAAQQADPVTGEQAPPIDFALEFPIFCDWAPTICEAAQTIISFPRTLTEWWETANSKVEEWGESISESWTAVKDWVKPEQPVETDTKVDIQEAPITVPGADANYLQWNAYCPFSADSSQIEINGEASIIDSDLSSWCQMASEIKPFVLLAGAIASLFIVSGVSVRGDD